MQATARIFIQKAPAKKTKDDLCPVKLCITHKRDRKLYSIAERLKKDFKGRQFLSDNDIVKVTSDSPRGKFKDIALEYERIVKIAEGIINDIPQFSFNQFDEKYFNKVASWDNVFTAIWGHIQDLKSEGRFGYASTFECALRSVKEFHEGKKFTFNPRKDTIETREKVYLGGKELRFVDITPEWLKRYEKNMQTEGLSKSTQGIYARNLRVLFNIAIKKHKVQAPYPFNEYKPKRAQGRKLALTAHQISLIAGYKTEHPLQQYYRDLFMFSFLANGINPNDIARLKCSNIKGGEINFVREKTKNKDTEVNIRVPVTRQMQSIIDKHGNRAIGHDAYVFPVLKPDWTDEMRYMQIKYFIKAMNKYLKQVAKLAGILENVSSYTARHSWATISKNSGASTEFIKEALGHSSVSVTEAYLKTFEKATRREHSEKMEDGIYNNKAM
jgi:integrase/recombinase XerD